MIKSAGPLFSVPSLGNILVVDVHYRTVSAVVREGDYSNKERSPYLIGKYLVFNAKQQNEIDLFAQRGVYWTHKSPCGCVLPVKLAMGERVSFYSCVKGEFVYGCVFSWSGVPDYAVYISGSVQQYLFTDTPCNIDGFAAVL